jgi:protein-L-isoaspartate(D-aspartate) O-methyltransferase
MDARGRHRFGNSSFGNNSFGNNSFGNNGFGNNAMVDSTAALRNMVDSQLRTNKVTDARLLAAMGDIPREMFVDNALRGSAYVDEDLPLGGGRYLMEPMVLARLVQALEIGADDLALDIGCATGYSAAVLAALASTVVALESDPALADRAAETLARRGIDNVVVVKGALDEGYGDQAPYDAILIDGAVPEIPQAILDQLVDGGRLAAVVGAGTGRATLVLRTGAVFARRVLFDAATPILRGFEKAPGFVF